MRSDGRQKNGCATLSMPADARAWAKALARYRQPSSARSITEIAVSIVPFAALWLLMAVAISEGYWLAVLLALPAAGFLLRLFMIQHDCGHGAFFGLRWANDWTGRILGIFTLTPYGLWRKTHALHHAGSGNLARRGFGDVHTLTLNEYRARSRFGRLRYRLYRHPIVMFGLGPSYLFFLQHRFPIGLMGDGLKPWISAMGTNLAIAVVAALLIWLIGVKAFVLVHLPITAIAATAGVWLFFVQHQFEDTMWDQEGDWSWHEAALHGSSYYDLPTIIGWFTANIGIHHVHHLCSRIPFYRLRRALHDHPQLQAIGRVSVRESFDCVRLVLWNPSQRRLISFREAAQEQPLNCRHVVGSEVGG